MADEEDHPPTTLFEVVRPDLGNASLVISSDVLVMMLGIIGALRVLLLIPAIDQSPASEEIRATVRDLERRIAATLKAIDELADGQDKVANDR